MILAIPFISVELTNASSISDGIDFWISARTVDSIKDLKSSKTNAGEPEINPMAPNVLNGNPPTTTIVTITSIREGRRNPESD